MMPDPFTEGTRADWDQRQELWDCFVASGADPDGADADSYLVAWVSEPEEYHWSPEKAQSARAALGWDRTRSHSPAIERRGRWRTPIVDLYVALVLTTLAGALSIWRHEWVCLGIMVSMACLTLIALKGEDE